MMLSLFHEFEPNPQWIELIGGDWPAREKYCRANKTTGWVDLDCIFCELTMDPLSFSCFYYGVTIFLAESLWIHFTFSDFTRESPSIAQIPYKLTRYFGIILCIHFLFRNHYVFTTCFANWLFTSVFANSLWIYHRFREITKDLLSYLRIHYEFTIFFSNSLSIHYLFREFTIFFANSLWIYYFRLLHNDNMYDDVMIS